MLQLTQGQTNESLIVTLTELITLNEPYFLFIFTHVTTKQVITKIYAPSDDISNHPERFNEFTINTSVVFANGTRGEWHYKVYEQASSTNVDPTGLNVLEYGKLRLNPSVEFSYTMYNPTTTYKAYNG